MRVETEEILKVCKSGNYTDEEKIKFIESRINSILYNSGIKPKNTGADSGSVLQGKTGSPEPVCKGNSERNEEINCPHDHTYSKMETHGEYKDLVVRCKSCNEEIYREEV